MALYIDSLGLYNHDWQSKNEDIPRAEIVIRKLTTKKDFLFIQKKNYFENYIKETLRSILNKNSILKIYLISPSDQVNIMNTSLFNKKKKKMNTLKSTEKCVKMSVKNFIYHEVKDITVELLYGLY